MKFICYPEAVTPGCTSISTKKRTFNAHDFKAAEMYARILYGLDTPFSVYSYKGSHLYHPGLEFVCRNDPKKVFAKR